MRTAFVLLSMVVMSASTSLGQTSAERKKQSEDFRSVHAILQKIIALRDRVGEQYAVMGEVLSLDDDGEPSHERPSASRFVIVKTATVDYRAAERALAVDNGADKYAAHVWEELVTDADGVMKQRHSMCFQSLRWDNEPQPFVTVLAPGVDVPRIELLDQLLDDPAVTSWNQTYLRHHALEHYFQRFRVVAYSPGTVHSASFVSRARPDSGYKYVVTFDPSVGMMPTKVGNEGPFEAGHLIDWYEHEPGLFLPSAIKSVTHSFRFESHSAVAYYCKLTWLLGDKVPVLDATSNEPKTTVMEAFGKTADEVIDGRMLYFAWRLSDEIYDGFNELKITAHEAHDRFMASHAHRFREQ